MFHYSSDFQFHFLQGKVWLLSFYNVFLVLGACTISIPISVSILITLLSWPKMWVFAKVNPVNLSLTFGFLSGVELYFLKFLFAIAFWCRLRDKLLHSIKLLYLLFFRPSLTYDRIFWFKFFAVWWVIPFQWLTSFLILFLAVFSCHSKRKRLLIYFPACFSLSWSFYISKHLMFHLVIRTFIFDLPCIFHI